jgi:hypothetical protein
MPSSSIDSTTTNAASAGYGTSGAGISGLFQNGGRQQRGRKGSLPDLGKIPARPGTVAPGKVRVAR